MTNVRFIVTAVERRSAVVAYLKQHVPNLEVVWDSSGKAMGGYTKALAQAGDDPFVLLEDDIILTQDFYSKITYEIAARPNDVIQFHSRSGKDLLVGSRYNPGRQFLNHQCVYFPAGMASKIFAFSRQDAYTDYSSPRCYSDVLTQDYLAQNRIKYWVSIPSLVDHLPDVSVVNAKRSKAGIRRQARVFYDPEPKGCPEALFNKWKPLT
tara:strand:+ start:462 stop:1088 length:627 start_codon:yes stop_codon:yes gene_type:complete